MTTWMLILALYVGAFGKYESNALTSVSGFGSEAQCKAAGEKAKGLETTLYAVKYVCVAAGGAP